MKIKVRRMDKWNITFECYDDNGKNLINFYNRKYYGNLEQCLQGAKRFLIAQDINKGAERYAMEISEIDKVLDKYSKIVIQVEKDV